MESKVKYVLPVSLIAISMACILIISRQSVINQEKYEKRLVELKDQQSELDAHFQTMSAIDVYDSGAFEAVKESSPVNLTVENDPAIEKQVAAYNGIVRDFTANSINWSTTFDNLYITYTATTDIITRYQDTNYTNFHDRSEFLKIWMEVMVLLGLAAVIYVVIFVIMPLRESYQEIEIKWSKFLDSHKNLKSQYKLLFKKLEEKNTVIHRQLGLLRNNKAQILRLARDQKELKNSFQRLKEEKLVLSEKYEAKSAKQEELKRELERKSRELEGITTNHALMEEKHGAIRQEIREIQTILDKKIASLDAMKLTSENADLRAKSASLETECELLKSSIQDKHTQIQGYEQEMKENDELRKQMNQQYQELLLESKINEQESHFIKQRLNEKEYKLDEVQSSLEQKTVELSVLKAENRDLEKEKESLEQEIDDKNIELKKIKLQISESESSTRRLEDENKQLKEVNEHLAQNRKSAPPVAQPITKRKKDFTWDFEAVNNTFHYSEELASLLGYSKAELGNGKNELKGHFHESDRQKFENTFRKVQAGQLGGFSGEYRVLSKSGETKWVKIDAKRVEDEHEIKIQSNVTDITDIHQAKSSLRDLSLVTDKIEDAVMIIGEDNQIQWVNQRYEALSGYSSGELIGKSVNNFYGEFTTVYNGFSSTQVKHDGLHKQHEILKQNKNGDLHWVMMSVSPVYGEGGNLEKYILVERDIDQFKKQQERLAELSILAEKTDHFSVCVDRSGKIIWRNKQYSAEFDQRKSRDEFYAHLKAKRINHSDLIQVQEAVKKAQSSSLEIQFDQGDDQKVFSISISPFKENRDQEEILIIGKDVTLERTLSSDFQKTKEELLDVQERLEEQVSLLDTKETQLSVTLDELYQAKRDLEPFNVLAEKTDNAVTITDANGHLLWANKKLEELSGYSSEELRNSFIYGRLKGPKSNIAEINRISRLIREGRSFISNLFLESKEHRHYFVSIKGLPIHDEENNVDRYIIIERDLTKEKETEEKLENLSAIAGKITNAVVTVNAEGRIIWSNQRFQDTFLPGNEQVQDQDIDEVLDLEGNRKFSQYLFKEQNLAQVKEIDIKVGGANRNFSYSSTPMFADDLEVEKYLVIFTDVTERRELRSSLEAAEEKMQELMDGKSAIDEEIKKLTSQVEEETRNANHFSADSYDNAPIGISLINAKGQVEYANDEFFRIYGVDKGDLLNKTFTKVLRKGEIAAHKKAHQQFINGKGSDKEMNTFMAKDGVERTVSIVHDRIKGQEDEMKKLSFVVDLSKQKELEHELEDLQTEIEEIKGEQGVIEELQTRQKELQTALEESQVFSLVTDKSENAVLITDKNGKVEYVNAGFERLTGYRQQEVTGKKSLSFLRGADTDDKGILSANNGLKSNKPFNYEATYYTKHGEPYFASVSVTPAVDREGVVTKYIFIQNDLTQIKQAQSELQNFTTIANTTVNGVLIANVDGEIEWYNDQLRRMLNVSGHQLEGKRTEHIFGGFRSGNDFVGEMKRAINFGDSLKREITVHDPENRELSFSITISAIYDDTGRAHKSMVIFTDLSEQHKIENELARTEEKLENLQKEQSEYELQVTELTHSLDQAKDQIKEKSHEMDIMIHNAPIGICVTNPDGLFEQVNDSYCQIYGYRQEDLMGQHFTTVVKPEDIAFWKRKHDMFIAGKDETRGEFSVLSSKGKELHILADSARVIGQDGRPRKITYVVDLTERKKLEQETKDSEAQLRRLMDEQLLNAEKLITAERDLSDALEKANQRSHELDIMIHNAPIGICVTDMNGKFVQINDSYCQIYGFRREELEGQSFTKVVKPEEVDFWKRKHDMFIQGRDETRGEFTVLAKNGKELHILADSARVQGPDGNPRKITYVVDMTERKKLEKETQEAETQMRVMVDEQLANTEKLMIAERKLSEALTESNQRSQELNIMIDNAPIGICVTNPDGLFEQVNDSYCEIYGYRREDLVGQPFTKVVKHKDIDFWNKKHKMFIEGRDETRGEFNVLSADGKELHILADSARIIGTDGQPRKITYVVDMTERKRLEKETQEAEEQMRLMVDQQLENTEKLLATEDRLNEALAISKKRENELDVMIDNAPIGICVTNPSGHFEQVNDSYCEIYGYDRSELIGESFTKVVKKKDTDFWNKKHEMFIDGRDETRGEFNVVSKDGKELHILADSARIIGSDGLPRKITYVVDMTERKRLEKETQEAEEQMRKMIDEQLENTERLIKTEKELSEALTIAKHRSDELDVMIDNAPIGICVTDPDGLFEHVNDSYCEIYGYKSHELIGESFTKVVKKKDIDFWNKKHDMFIAGSDETRGEFNVVASDGSELHILADSARIIGADGRPRKITYVVDMTERKRLEKETQEAEEQMRTMLEKQYEDAELLINKEKELKKALEVERASKEELDRTMVRLKETQTQMVQNEKMASIGQLTAGIAHEINNPINFVYNGIDSLKMSLDDLFVIINKFNQLDGSQDVAAFIAEVEGLKKKLRYDRLVKNLPTTLDDIRTGASRTIEIVKGLRVFSRLDEEERKAANINECLDSTLILLRNKTKDKIKVKKFFDDHVGDIMCYPGQLNQVFMNLITNGIQAIPEDRHDGELMIYTENLQDTVIVRIMDNGSGIPEDIQKKIFEPFYTTKPVGIGTGLGLSISYGIIEKHNGKIYVNSEVNKGTEFVIELPKELK